MLHEASSLRRSLRALADFIHNVLGARPLHAGGHAHAEPLEGRMMLADIGTSTGAYVRNGTYSDDNFGSAATLQVKLSSNATAISASTCPPMPAARWRRRSCGSMGSWTRPLPAV